MNQASEKIKISVVVCTYNRANLLKICLDSLINQTFRKDFYEIIVVDNNSTDHTATMVKEMQKKYLAEFIRFMKEAKQGLSYARNAGYQVARGELISYIDDDAQADRDWLNQIVNAFETIRPIPAAVGGVILPYYLDKKPDWFLDKLETITWGDHSKFLDHRWASYGFSGSNMTFPGELLKRYNGFLEHLGMKGSTSLVMGEESDLFFRIYRDQPYFWFDPEIKVEHWVPLWRMGIIYRLKRSFSSGVTIVQVGISNGQKVISIQEILKAILKNFITLVFRVRWWNQYWKSDFLAYAEKLFRALGNLYGNFFKSL
ncbi:glycosyltransferase [Candidatus Auribacterota bacterium]